MSGGSMHITSAEKAKGIPLAEELFTIPEVESVFLASDFISVTKQPDADWFVVKADVIATLIDYLSVHGQVKIAEGSSSHQAESEEDISYDEKTAQIVENIKDIIETKVRPSVAMDGGDIIFKKFVDGIVFLELHGACSGCPSSTVTLKQGIENMLRHYIPEVQAVQAVGG